jgi:dienelactone hydrolase
VLARFVIAFVVIATCSGVVVAASPRLPKPTGPWPVGTTIVSFEANDTTQAPIVARAWYPASLGSRGARASYQYGSTARSLKERVIGMFVHTDALRDVPIVRGRAPVIVYLPGMGGRSFHNSAQTQELASHGYVVFAVDDTQPTFDFDASSASGIRKSEADGDRKIRLQARDIGRLLDELRRREASHSGFFSQHLALEHVGAFGFSFGGAVAAELAAIDPRFVAAIDLDGSMYGTSAAEGVAKPFLYVTSTMSSEGPLEVAYDRKQFASLKRGLRRHGGYLLSVAGTDHYNFTDASVFPSLRRTGFGSIDGALGERIVTQYILAFFNRHLRSHVEPLIDGGLRFDRAATFTTYRRFGN